MMHMTPYKRSVLYRNESLVCPYNLQCAITPTVKTKCSCEKYKALYKAIHSRYMVSGCPEPNMSAAHFFRATERGKRRTSVLVLLFGH